MKCVFRLLGHGHSHKGFTLIEVVIATFLLGVAILALASLTVSAIKGNAVSKRVTTGSTLAKDQIEFLRSQAQIGDTEFNGITSTAWAAVSGFAGYERRQIVTSTVGNSLCTAAKTPNACCTGSAAGKCPDHKDVSVEVRWQSQGAYRDVKLSTIITQF